MVSPWLSVKFKSDVSWGSGKVLCRGVLDTLSWCFLAWCSVVAELRFDFKMLLLWDTLSPFFCCGVGATVGTWLSCKLGRVVEKLGFRILGWIDLVTWQFQEMPFSVTHTFYVDTSWNRQEYNHMLSKTCLQICIYAKKKKKRQIKHILIHLLYISILAIILDHFLASFQSLLSFIILLSSLSLFPFL